MNPDQMPRNEQRDAEWDGDGRPPVGAEFEYYRPEGEEWRHGKCVHHYQGGIIVIDCDDGLPVPALRPQLRLIRSEEDKAVEGMAKALERNHGSPCSVYHGYCRTLFRLGYRKEPGHG